MDGAIRPAADPHLLILFEGMIAFIRGRRQEHPSDIVHSINHTKEQLGWSCVPRWDGHNQATLSACDLHGRGMG
jgi:hypothetical protein